MIDDVRSLILGTIVHQRREDLGISQTTFGATVGLTQSKISRLEHGHLSVDFFLAKTIETALDLRPDELLPMVENAMGRAQRAVLAMCPNATWQTWMEEAKALKGLDTAVTFSVAAMFVDRNDLIECTQTLEQLTAELEAVEAKLAIRCGLQMPDVRGQLIALDNANNLVEDELVMDWHDLHSSFVHWSE